MCSITGVGERLHKLRFWGTLDSGERSLPFGLLVPTRRMNKMAVGSSNSIAKNVDID